MSILRTFLVAQIALNPNRSIASYSELELNLLWRPVIKRLMNPGPLVPTFNKIKKTKARTAR